MSFDALKWLMDDAPIPSSSAFAVLTVYASYANENGRAYPAATTVALKTRQNIKTVRAAIDALQDAGALIDTGRRVGETGNIPVYALGMEGVPEVGRLRGERAPVPVEREQEPIEASREEARPDLGGLTAAPSLPDSGTKPTRNREGEPTRNPIPPENANAFSAPRGAGKTRDRSFGDWAVPPITDLPSTQRGIASQWPEGAYASLGEGHRSWLLARTRRQLPGDLDASWHARIVQIGAQPLRDAKAGLRLVEGGGDEPPTDAQLLASAEQRARTYRRMGRADDADGAERDATNIRARLAAGSG